MIRTLTTALALSVALAIHAQETMPENNNDSIHSNVELGEIVVKGATVVNKNDRKLITPSDKQRELAHSGTDLVRLMQLPDVTVDPVSGALNMASAGNLKLRINGRPVDSKDIRAIDPKKVTRVEYHDNPSLRYGDADLVLDFIVKSDQQGGRLDAMEQIVPIHGFEWQQNFDLSINHKRSEFQFEWWNENTESFKTWRENTETYNLADGSSFTRIESGIPTPCSNDDAHGMLKYNYFNPDKELLSIELKATGGWNNKTTYKGVLHSSLDNSDILTYDESEEKYVKPNLDIYYQRNLNKDRLLIFNVVGQYRPQDSFRNYQEYNYTDENQGNQLYDITNDIKNRSYSLLAEADYEQTWKGRRLTVGGRYSGNWSRSEYINYDTVQKLQKHSGDVFAEWWWQMFPHFDITAGMNGSLKSYKLIGGVSSTKWMWEPKLNFRYKLDGGHTLRLNYKGNGTTPSLDELSPVRQQVDGYQASVGNQDLTPYMTHNFSFRYEYSHGSFYGQLMANYTLAHNPIADEKNWDNGVVLSTYDNQKDYHKLSFRCLAHATVIPDWFDVDASLTWNRMIFLGNNYCHTYNQLIPYINASVTHWHWALFAQYQATPRNLWGETVWMSGSNGGNYHLIGLSYNHKQWQFNLIAFNPFSVTGGIESNNLNKYAGYKRTQRINFINQNLILQVQYSIEWGRHYESADKKVNNELKGQSASAAKK